MLMQMNTILGAMAFDSCSEFSLTDGSVGKNVIIFAADMSLSVDNDRKIKIS